MFDTVDFGAVRENLARTVAEEWMLISAGDETGYNMMTASWGTVGSLWGADVATVFVRPARYTMEYLKTHDRFSLSFYGKNAFAKQMHAVCGAKSGRDLDKAAATGLSPVFSDGTVFFEQARLVLICQKQYVGAIDPAGFCTEEIAKWYPEKDYHNVLIGKIEKVLVQK